MTVLGVSLLVVGVILILVEAHVQSLGILGLPGAIALGAGAIITVGSLGGGLVVALVMAVALIAASAGLLTLTLRKGMAVRRRLVSGGREGVIGHHGVVCSWSDHIGKVNVDGALWRARKSWGEEDPENLRAGDEIIVEQLSGLTLGVRRAEEWER